MTDKEMQARDKVPHQGAGEGTRDVPVYIPAVDILETEDALTLIADMPGVPPEAVTIDINEGELTLVGVVADDRVEGEHALLTEYGVGDYFRRFTLGKSIDQSRIEATMKDGILTVVLPKAEKLLPRKISVKTG